MSKSQECVKVVVRCRPLSKKELDEDRKQIVFVNQNRGEMQVINPKGDPSEPQKTFTFDNTFEPDVKQELVYMRTAYPIVESVLEGYNGTIFAYGQTGTGKTHTMEGKDNPKDQRGIIPRTFEHIFKVIKGTPNVQFLVRVSYLELYNEEIRDLLQKNIKKLELREKPGSGIYVKDLSTFMIQDPQEMNEKLMQGGENRSVGATQMNQDSSRSHSIFSITVERCDQTDSGESHIRVGKLNLVDLAGSERQNKTQATGSRLKEAININQSLTTLGNVISSLIDPKSTHIPYRDSKLTRLLQDSLGGNTKTVMVANVGPADYNYDETISTLRYAHRAKSIQNKPKINEDPKDAMIRQFQDEINRLKQQLAQSVDSNTQIEAEIIQVEKVIHVNDDETIQSIQDKLNQDKQEFEKKIKDEIKNIEEDKKLQEHQKMKLIQQLKEKEEKEQHIQEEREKLLKKIQKMEEKVIQGDQIMQQALEKERELIRAQQKIQETRNEQQKMAQEIRKNEEMAMEMDRRYKNSKEEVDDKTKRIKDLIIRLKQIESENGELEEFYAQEIEELQVRHRALQKELKLKNLILQYFIPEKEIKRLQTKAMFRQDLDNWTFPNFELSGNMLKIKQQAQDNEYEQQDVKEILELEKEGHPNMFYMYTDDGIVRVEEVEQREGKKMQKKSTKKRPTSKMQSTSKRPQSGKKNTTLANEEENFPKAKGLVQKK
ncbi:kinesin motor domain protein [Ichthyophthirius multifiliis]|uniref:Kinesin-like protein n=1 Tax=Ichthyophthirius multifiliis TaxID=5932 RepID=G0R0U9_ICHMU|nr:kinesin motor domain protein [Ichthyophthirius multifiliis]EGR28909.1 kinesin motor domain protein [Ichthyophthirius multifiliis]|eukprot:XP_004030145.1 kinesin motor domain protein [Ichthyophthirius multifiliis]